MKTPDKYRFTLQWSAETDEKVRVGDFLESLGNRKSELVVVAINEYITSHPEMIADKRDLKIVVKPNVTQEHLKAMVLAMIEEKLACIDVVGRDAGYPHDELSVTGTEIDEMLSNLDIFSEK